MKLVDPVVAPSVATAALAPRLATLDGMTIGLWSNTKLNAKELLDACEVELRRRWKIAGTVRGYYHAAKVLGPAEWGEIDRCNAVILTHGD
jgi:hypothetical protein